jgi:hypothetical protein
MGANKMFKVNENEKTWQRAKTKAADKRPAVEIEEFGNYIVAGSAGGRYHVTIQDDEAGIEINCSCLAGANDKACYHAAAALAQHRAFTAPQVTHKRDRRLGWIESDLRQIARLTDVLSGDREAIDEVHRAVRAAFQALKDYECDLDREHAAA